MSPRLLRLTICALLALMPLAGASQTKSAQHSGPLAEASPSAAGMSAERLARIDAMIETAIKEDRIPGAVALVARNGKIVYHRAFGQADNGTGRALKKDDIFRIASQSKAITATAVMMLWEEGRFQLDDSIAKWIPEFKDAGVSKTLTKPTGRGPQNRPISPSLFATCSPTLPASATG